LESGTATTYLVIPGGIDQEIEPTPFVKENPNFGDRFCGERLSALNLVGAPTIGAAPQLLLH